MSETIADFSRAQPIAATDRLARLRRQYRVLSASNRALINSIREHELLTDVCRALVNIGGYRFAWIGCFGAHAGIAPEPTASAAWGNGALDPSQFGGMHALGDQTPALRAMRERAPQIALEIEDGRWSTAWREQARHRGHVAALAMPLLADDQCLGVLEVYTDRSAGFEMSEVVLLNEIAADLAFGVVTMRTRREYARQQADIALLTRVLKMQSAINSAVLRIRDANNLLAEACRVAVEVGCYNSAVVWVVEPGARYARTIYRTGRQVPDVAPKRLPIGDGNERDIGLTARAMRTGEVSVCCDLTRNEPPLIGRELLFANGVRSVVALPFMIDGVPVGALTLTSRDSSQVRDVELLLLQDIAVSLSFALRSQQQADAAEYLIHYDPLTDGEDGNTLVQKAEAALKHAKETGEPSLPYKLDMRRAMSERLLLEHKLREAIDGQQFELVYQPQVNVESGRIESLEALLRKDAAGCHDATIARCSLPMESWIARRSSTRWPPPCHLSAGDTPRCGTS